MLPPRRKMMLRRVSPPDVGADEDGECILYGPDGRPVSVVEVGELVRFVPLVDDDEDDCSIEWDDDTEEGFGFMRAASDIRLYGDGEPHWYTYGSA